MGITDEQGSRFLLAQNHAVDFYFYYPENFILDINAAMISLFMSDPEFAEFGPVNPNLSVTVFSRAGDLATAQEWWEQYVLLELSEVFQDIFIESEDNIEIDGIPGRKYVYTFTLGGQNYRQAQIIFFRSSEVYKLVYTATANRFSAHLNVLDAVAETFKFK